MSWTVYLSGEIHSDWRQQLADGAAECELPIIFTSAVTDHDASDAAGDLLGGEDPGSGCRDFKIRDFDPIAGQDPLYDFQ